MKSFFLAALACALTVGITSTASAIQFQGGILGNLFNGRCCGQEAEVVEEPADDGCEDCPVIESPAEAPCCGEEVGDSSAEPVIYAEENIISEEVISEEVIESPEPAVEEAEPTAELQLIEAPGTVHVEPAAAHVRHHRGRRLGGLFRGRAGRTHHAH